VKAAAPHVKDRSHMVERLKKRLTEALRQRNVEKIAQIQGQIASLTPAASSTASSVAVPAATPVAEINGDNSTADAAHVSNASHETSPIE